MRRRFSRSLGVVAGVVAAMGSLFACTFTRDLDYLTDAPQTGTEPDAAIEEPDVKKEKDASKDDAPAVTTPEGGCEAGTIRPPIGAVAFVGSVGEGQTPQAVTCQGENILVDDGQLVGLDRTMNGDVGRSILQNVFIAGCAGVEFDHDVSVVAVKLGPVPDACGVSPCVMGASDGCGTGTGRQAVVYAGVDTNPENLKLVSIVRYNDQFIVFRDDLSLKTESHDPILGARVVIVCRNGNVSVTRDDVGVDAVWDECK